MNTDREKELAATRDVNVACACFEDGITKQTQDYQFRYGPNGEWLKGV